MRNNSSRTMLIAALAGLVTAPASAAILTGAGPNLPIPSPNPTWPPGVSPTRVQTGPTFTGTWAAGTVHANWVGTYNVVGTIPSSFDTGSKRYDFTTLPLGYLPAGTFFIFGDVDGGSGNPERFDLTAFDASNTIINTEWLGAPSGPNTVHSVTGSGTGSGGSILPNNMPGWSWQGTNPNGYHVTGASVTGGNPNVALALVSNQDVYGMILNKPTTHYGFVLQAPLPVPEPGAFALLLAGLTASLAATRRNR